MPQVRLSKEAERTLQKIIAIWPQIMHQQRKEKILTMLSLLMGREKFAPLIKPSLLRR